MRRLLLAAVLLLPACSKKRYHWDDVPYCALDGGPSAGHFTTTLRVLTRHSDGGGVSSLHGMRPHRDVEFTSEILVAVVACSEGDLPASFDLEAFLREFDASTIPEVCPGQRVVVQPTRVTATETDAPGYHGALPFPTVPQAELQCSGGTVALGRGG